MITRQRRRHRDTIILLAIVVPPLFAAAMLSRPALPPLVAETPLLPQSAGESDAMNFLWQKESVVEGLRTRVRVHALKGKAEQAESGYLADVQVYEGLLKADVLIYFASGESESETLPADAFLLGPASVGRNVYRLPQAYPAAPGRLLYFSLATQELLDQVALPANPEQGGAM